MNWLLLQARNAYRTLGFIPQQLCRQLEARGVSVSNLERTLAQ